jgi:putative transposase
MPIRDFRAFVCYNVYMKLTAMVKLNVNPQQSAALLTTLEAANRLCDGLSEWAWQNKTFGPYAIQKERYACERENSGLTAQVVIRCISKVADAYKLDKQTKREFAPHGAIAYDDRILHWYVERRTVSIWTVAGRMTLPFVTGERQCHLLKTRHGESDLCYRDGEWFLFATCNVETPPPLLTEGFLGVDLGIVEVASDSEGNHYSGQAVKTVRKKVGEHRRKLQARQTNSAKKRLRKVASRQSRFVKNSNHVISKKLVATALALKKAIALEDLSGIRERTRDSATRTMRWLLGNWAFDQLAVCRRELSCGGIGESSAEKIGSERG